MKKDANGKVITKGTVTISVEEYNRLKEVDRSIDQVINDKKYFPIHQFMFGDELFFTLNESEIIEKLKESNKDLKESNRLGNNKYNSLYSLIYELDTLDKNKLISNRAFRKAVRESIKVTLNK